MKLVCDGYAPESIARDARQRDATGYAQLSIVRSCDGSTGRHEALPTIDRSKRHARQIIRRFDSATTAGEDAAHAPGKSG